MQIKQAALRSYYESGVPGRYQSRPVWRFLFQTTEVYFVAQKLDVCKDTSRRPLSLFCKNRIVLCRRKHALEHLRLRYGQTADEECDPGRKDLFPHTVGHVEVSGGPLQTKADFLTQQVQTDQTSLRLLSSGTSKLCTYGNICSTLPVCT